MAFKPFALSLCLPVTEHHVENIRYPRTSGLSGYMGQGRMSGMPPCHSGQEEMWASVECLASYPSILGEKVG